MAVLIDGKAVSERRRIILRGRVQDLVDRGHQPCLVALSVREDHGWSVYLKGQASACAAVGIRHRQVVLPKGASQDDLLECIEGLNLDPAVHGILLQSPLGEGFDAFQAQARLSPDKDVEGVGPANLGLVLAGRPALAPCTALSAVALAQEAFPDLRGVDAVVIGASTIVGKPVGQLLTAAGATVTICQITTRDVRSHCQRADLVVVAVGKAGLVTPDWIKPGAVVVDVGINRVTGPDGRSLTVGDVDPAVAGVAGFLTPVPGGVGSLTTTILLESTVAAANRLATALPSMDPSALARLLGGADLPTGAADRIALLLARHLPGLAAGVATSALERRLASVGAGGGALIMDGALGTELIDRGLPALSVAEANLDHPDLVREIHRAYRAAGAELLTTNTFSINRFRCTDPERMQRQLSAGARLARQAAEGAMVLGSIGPLGPVVGAEITPEVAADAFAEVALALSDAGVDGLLLETMPSTTEAVAALRGIRRVSRLPVLACRTMVRADPAELAEFARAMEEGGASAVGINCTAGPRALLPVVATLAGVTRLPVIARPNAGFPTRDGAELRYHLRPEYLEAQGRSYLAAGVGILGGCCGVGPRHILALAQLRGEAPGSPAPIRFVERNPSADPGPHPLVTAMRGGAFPILAFISGRLDPAEAAAAAERLSQAGADAVGLLSGWPGAPRGPRLVATLAHVATAAARPAVLDLVAGEVTLAQAEERLLSAHLLGVRLVVVDAGVFAGAPRYDVPGGGDALALVWLIHRLNDGRGLAGARLDQPTQFTVGVRVPMTDGRASEYAAAGASFLTIPPVYEPPVFRRRLAELSSAGLPVLAEVLLLPDAATADELDNELPALSVPQALHRRLAEDPTEDTRGVQRFVAAWRTRLAGLCILCPDGRTGPAEAVLRGR